MCEFEDEIADASAKEKGFLEQEKFWRGKSSAEVEGQDVCSGNFSDCCSGGGFFVW